MQVSSVHLNKMSYAHSSCTHCPKESLFASLLLSSFAHFYTLSICPPPHCCLVYVFYKYIYIYIYIAHSCSLLKHPNSLCGGIFTLNTKFDADSLLYSLSNFESDGHTVHMLTQRRLLPPLTSTVKSSLFTHAHSSPLSLAARSHRCHYYRYINNINHGWIFSGQISFYIYIHIFFCLLLPPSFIQTLKPLPSDSCQSFPCIHASVSISFIGLVC